MMIITAYALQKKKKNYTIKCIKSRNENENRKRKSDRENGRKEARTVNDTQTV